MYFVSNVGIIERIGWGDLMEMKMRK